MVDELVPPFDKLREHPSTALQQAQGNAQRKLKAKLRELLIDYAPVTYRRYEDILKFATKQCSGHMVRSE